MKKLLIVALVGTSMAGLGQPAHAAVVQPTIDELNTLCGSAPIIPANPAGFYALADASSVTPVYGNWVMTSRVLISDIPGGTVLSAGTPTFNGERGRNGQSPNIFGTFETVTVVSGGSKTQEITEQREVKFSYRCIVYNRQGNVVQGQQPDSPFLTAGQIESRTRTETVSNPNITTTVLSEKVICISPTRNPGVWRQQNGYTGVCSTQLFNSLGSITIHSNSLPPLEELSVPADFSSPLEATPGEDPVIFIDETMIEEI